MKFLFLNGGPGFNSNPENHLLSSLFESKNHHFLGWHEPSVRRGTDSSALGFENTLNSVRDFLEEHCDGETVVIGHSFATNFVLECLDVLEAKGSKLVMMAPAMNYLDLDKRIIQLSLNDFSKDPSSKPNVQALQEYLESGDETFSAEREAALMLAASNPMLFTHYFRSLSNLEKQFQYFTGEYEFDIEEFFAVRRSIRPYASKKKSKIQPVVIFSKTDPVIDSEQEIKSLESIFENIEVNYFENSNHYMHVEEPEKFVDVCINALGLRLFSWNFTA